MQDIVFSQCERELKIDFLELDRQHLKFLLEFNSHIYIENNPGLHLYDATQFVQNYQNIVEAYILTQTERSQKLLINKKYIPYILLNKDLFFELFSHQYNSLFTRIDMFFAKDSENIQIKIIQGVHEMSGQETTH